MSIIGVTVGTPINPNKIADDLAPTISVVDITGGHRITITDKEGTKTFDVMDGTNGKNGTDGVSPAISVTTITGGHRITITDKNGTKNVDVMDGTDGKNGSNGRGITSVTRTSGNGSAGTTDTYTIKYTDNTTSTFTVYNGKNGSNGADGKAGADGFSPTISAMEFQNGHTVTITDKNGTNSFDVLNGTNGRDGTSVTITELIETEDDSERGVLFSDGTMLFIKNGKDGINGKDGTSVTVSNVTTSSADGGSNVVTFSDGKTLTVKNGSKGSEGEDGDDGERGFSILRVTTAPSAYTTATGGFTPAYRIALSTVKSQASVDEVRVGDTILRNYYTYKVGYVDASYAYLTTYASIRGSAGAAGKDGATAEEVIAAMSTETWTFTLADGSTVTKVVPLI